jgi:dTDP-4-dehydrorhamnose reductase
MMKILITGGSGLLGINLICSFLRNFELYATYNSFPIEIGKVNVSKLDITNQNKVFQLFKNINPEVVIHTAALTNVDICEKNYELARIVNIEGTKNIAEACSYFNSKMVYISTDYVFDGKKGNYSENDTTNPLNYYGKTKLEGERVVKLTENYLILRSSLYGWNIQSKFSFAEWILDNLKKNQQINVLTDQYSSLMLVNNFSEVLLKMIEQDLNGLYNVASREKINKFNFAQELAKVFDLDENLIIPISSPELSKKIKQTATRPRNVSLNINKISKKIGTMPSIYEGLENMKKLKPVK